MFIMVGTAVTGAMLIAILLAALNGSEKLPSLSWIAFTAFPFAALILTASLVRIQQRITMRAPQQHLPQDGETEGQ